MLKSWNVILVFLLTFVLLYFFTFGNSSRTLIRVGSLEESIRKISVTLKFDLPFQTDETLQNALRNNEAAS